MMLGLSKTKENDAWLTLCVCVCRHACMLLQLRDGFCLEGFYFWTTWLKMQQCDRETMWREKEVRGMVRLVREMRGHYIEQNLVLLVIEVS